MAEWKEITMTHGPSRYEYLIPEIKPFKANQIRIRLKKSDPEYRDVLVGEYLEQVLQQLVMERIANKTMVEPGREVWCEIEGFTNFEVLMNGLNPPRFRKRIPIDHPDGYKYMDPTQSEERFIVEILRLRADNARLEGLVPQAPKIVETCWKPVQGFPEYEQSTWLNPPRFRDAKYHTRKLSSVEERLLEAVTMYRWQTKP